MLQNNLLLFCVLLLIVSLLSIVSQKLRVSYPIVLVISGLFISFIPNIPIIKLEPDIIFVIFLPPLLHAAAWETSWFQFWNSRRAIGLLAIGLVIFTASSVAVVSHLMIPGFSLAMGFILGGIISPPDAIAATSILRGLPVPKKIITILEGESLVNDATSLTVFRFALAAVATGSFSLIDAGIDFVIVSVMGVAIGLGIAFIVYFLYRKLPTSPSVDTAISIIAPFLMYITAEHFHYSGVLAVVSGGLFLSFRSNDIFTFESRIQVQSVWSSMVFILNGVVFILIGLQLPEIMKGIEGYSIGEVMVYAIVISLVTIFIRILWVYPATYLPRWFSRKIRKKEKRPDVKMVFIVAWSGMRGVVSLASALAIPLTIAPGTRFPHRELILFITFIVIFFTLVLQGLSLPYFIKWLNIAEKDKDEENKLEITMLLSSSVLKFLDANYQKDLINNPLFAQLKSRHEGIVEDIEKRLSPTASGEERSPHIAPYRKVLLELIDVRRKELVYMRDSKQFVAELLRSVELELDLEEARLRHQSI